MPPRDPDTIVASDRLFVAFIPSPEWKPSAIRSWGRNMLEWAPMDVQSTLSPNSRPAPAYADDEGEGHLRAIYSPRYEQGEIVLSAEDFAKIEALLEDESGPTPAMLELFRKA